jgi:Tfp pilus assembly protein PilO
MDSDDLMLSGNIFQPSQLQPANVQREGSDEARQRRNEKRRQRYAAKHSKKAKLSKLHADKAALEAKVKALMKQLGKKRK